jgi:hypothetical protein
MVVICVQGPTEAERKIEELTRQLEEEMEKQEEEGEYFGKLLSLNFNSRKVIFGGPICSPHAIGECFCDILFIIVEGCSLTYIPDVFMDFKEIWWSCIAVGSVGV